MGIEDLKKYIIQQINGMDETDFRFLNQLCTFIKMYKKKQGH